MMIGDFDTRKIPIIGSDIGQVGQAIELITQPCSPDPWIGIKAAWTYAPTLLWSLFAPDPIDQAFERAGRPHKRVRKGKINVGDVMQLPQPSKPGLGLALFTGAQLAQKVGWWFVIADATSDFLINWTSMAYHWSGCKVEGAPWAHAKSTDIQFTQTNVATETYVWMHEHAHGLGASSGNNSVTIASKGPKTFSGTISATAEPWADSPGIIESVHWDRSTDGHAPKRIVGKQLDPADPASPFQVTDELLAADWPKTQWTGRIKWSGGSLTQHYAACSAVGAPGADGFPSIVDQYPNWKS